jgi:hypothetical protein
MKTLQPESPNAQIYYKVVSSYNKKFYSALVFWTNGNFNKDVVRYQVGKWTFPKKIKDDYRLSVFGSLGDALDFIDQLGPLLHNPRIYTCECLTDSHFTHERNSYWSSVYRTGGVRLLNKVKKDMYNK